MIKILNADPIREAFENVTYHTFGMDQGISNRRDPVTGVYVSPTLEDHWQTFQEGWECALNHLKTKTNPGYSDVVSDGGMDPRNP